MAAVSSKYSSYRAIPTCFSKIRIICHPYHPP
nr:MAG TPA: hypothetical protein [Caudoviricetes sp.]